MGRRGGLLALGPQVLRLAKWLREMLATSTPFGWHLRLRWEGFRRLHPRQRCADGCAYTAPLPVA